MEYLIIFPSIPYDICSIDPCYAAEEAAARAAGLDTALIDIEVLGSDPGKATRKLPCPDSPVRALYRGWMMNGLVFEVLHRELAKKNIHLVTQPEEYWRCHHLPDIYPTIAAVTPMTAWLPIPECTDMAKVVNVLEHFGDGPVLIKDYVKSRKHEWAEACYIPRASDTEAALAVVRTFLERQGTSLCRGLVIRKYEPLRRYSTHAQSGIPLFVEQRVFVYGGDVIAAFPYWGEEEAKDVADLPQVPLEEFGSLFHAIDSAFFSIDLAMTEDGRWIVIEVGDGQVSGLPSGVPLDQFYLTLERHMRMRKDRCLPTIKFPTAADVEPGS